MSRTCYAFGSRSMMDGGVVARTLKQLAAGCDELWSGAAGGADTLAAAWGRAAGLKVREWPAEWARLGRQAGIRRNEELIAALPADAVCVAFAPRGVAYPGPEAIRIGGGVRKWLTDAPGTRHAIGCCLGRGLTVWFIWADGSMTRLTPAEGVRQRDGQSKTERMDLDDDAGQDTGEFGFDQSATDGRPSRRFAAAPTAKTAYRLGQVIVDEKTSRRWKVVRLTNGGTTAILRPLHATAQDDGPERILAHPDDAAVRPGFDPLLPDFYLGDTVQPGTTRSFGDGERRSQSTLETRRRFQPRGRLVTCRMCGEPCRPREGTDDICEVCAELVFA